MTKSGTGATCNRLRPASKSWRGWQHPAQIGLQGVAAHHRPPGPFPRPQIDLVAVLDQGEHFIGPGAQGLIERQDGVFVVEEDVHGSRRLAPHRAARRQTFSRGAAATSAIVVERTAAARSTANGCPANQQASGSEVRFSPPASSGPARMPVDHSSVLAAYLVRTSTHARGPQFGFGRPPVPTLRRQRPPAGDGIGAVRRIGLTSGTFQPRARFLLASGTFMAIFR